MALASEHDAQSTVELLNIKVYSPYQVYYDNQAKSISAVNHTGPFDVLARHHSFISIIDPCEIVIVKLDDSQLKIRIAGGVMHVRNNKVTLFLDV